MASTLRTTLRLTLASIFSDEAGSFSLSQPAIQRVLTNGTGIDQADVLHVKQYSINTAGATVLNLQDGSLKQRDNSNAAFVKACGLYIGNLSPVGSTTQIVRAGGGSNPLNWMANAQIVGGPGASFVKFDPSLVAYPVTASTAMNLSISADAGAAVPVLVVIFGRSA